ncbi:MAG: EF-hand domain-containing protein, partial [Phycisphaerales bacterium]
LGRTTAGALFVRERILHASIVSPRNLHATARGTIVFTSDGVVRELARSGTSTMWQSVSTVAFVGQTVGPLFTLQASRFISGEWTGTVSDFTTNPPDNGPGVPYCLVDFNNDGFAEPGDLDEFITAYFSDDPMERARCDFNGDGFVEPGDLDEFITAFFEGC